MKKWIEIIGIVGVIGIGALVVARGDLLINQDPVVVEEVRTNPESERVGLKIGKVIVLVEIRDSPEEMSLGLSYRESLDYESGMAFVYSKPQEVMYWMKDMNFPLDFVWVANGVVVEITDAVPAPTTEDPVPKTVAPSQPVDMVVEVNSGFVQQREIRVGDKVSWVK